MRRNQVRKIGPLTWWYEEDVTRLIDDKIPEWGLRFTLLTTDEKVWHIIANSELYWDSYHPMFRGWSVSETSTGKVWKLTFSNTSKVDSDDSRSLGTLTLLEVEEKWGRGELTISNLRMVRHIQAALTRLGQRLGLRI